MAILSAVPGLSVHIRIAGERVVEYPDPEGTNEAEPLESSCYIESKAGEEFAIETEVTPEFSLRPRRNAFVTDIYIDGSWMSADTVNPIEAVRQANQTAICSKAYTASEDPKLANLSKFKFIPVVTNEGQDKADAADSNISKSLGVIIVKVSVCVYHRGGKTVSLPKFDRKSTIDVSEKLLKGRDLAHGSSLSSGEVVRCPAGAIIKHKRHVGTFHFHYRSHEALQRQLIIPRSPSPSTPGDDDELEGLTEKQIRNLARERLHGVKVENSRSIKRERTSLPRDPRPMKLVRLEDGTEAIDLTDD